jgi:tetratricopeptide (TPR) repeat protein
MIAAWTMATVLSVWDPQGPAELVVLQRWVAAVKEHEPGRRDAALATVASFRYADRSNLNSVMNLFLAVLRAEPVRTKNDTATRVAALARPARENPGRAAFLKRAALLHTDAVVFADDFPAIPDESPPPPPPKPGRREPDPPPPLLTNERFMLHHDGRVLGEAVANWNWPFARSLLDELLPAPVHDVPPGPCRGADCTGVLRQAGGTSAADRALIGDWYHAVTAFLFANGKHGDATKHLEHAARIMPEDPRVLFDRGCYAETLGLPIYQVLPTDPQTWTRNGIFPMLPGEEKTNREAEKLFRHALEVLPAFAEARVRLARLLERRGQHDEAAAEVDAALAVPPPAAVAYLAHLVGGRVAHARKRYDEALQHYREASTLYPDAQSALLGASQAALMAADVSATLDFVHRLSSRSQMENSDPWWRYELGAGRDVDMLLAEIWATVPR